MTPTGSSHVIVQGPSWQDLMLAVFDPMPVENHQRKVTFHLNRPFNGDYKIEVRVYQVRTYAGTSFDFEGQLWDIEGKSHTVRGNFSTRDRKGHCVIY